MLILETLRAKRYPSLLKSEYSFLEMYLQRPLEIRRNFGFRKANPHPDFPGNVMYVVFASGRVAIAKDGNYNGSHTDLARKRKVIAAGWVHFEKIPGQKRKTHITNINNASGHYKPAADSLPLALKVMRRRGFHVASNATIRIHQ